MPCAVEISRHACLADLPADAQALFALPLSGPGVAGFYDSQAWYRLLLATALPADTKPEFWLLRQQGRAVAVLALLRLPRGNMQALTSPYTCLHRVLLASDLAAAQVEALGVALAAALRRQGGRLRLDALAGDWPALTPLCRGVRRGGLAVLRFEHFGNWHAAVPADGWAAYLASRSGALRETIRRRGAKIARDPAFRFEMVRGGTALEPAIAAFEAVYARSWKEPEPFIDFNAAMLRLVAGLGVLRLALLWHATQPVAVQYWIVVDGTAQILKLAHDPQFEPFSPGTVLTAWSIARLLEGPEVRELDFGRGDDAYKRLWVDARRQRVGVIFANPREIDGLAIILRHQLGRLHQRLRGLRGRFRR